MGDDMASKRSKACDISPKVRKEVLERDNHCCIICGANYGLQIAHYISRARLGLGIPQNLAVMCVHCHSEMDNGKYHKELQKAVKEHLTAHYDNWNEKDLVYRRWEIEEERED
jgi:5-methylcytosine-specific restriction endonuclease McrA